LLAAELHQRVHLDADAAVGLRLQLLAHALDGFDRRIAQRMHVRGFPDDLILRRCNARYACKGDGRTAQLDEIATLHEILLERWRGCLLRALLIARQSRWRGPGSLVAFYIARACRGGAMRGLSWLPM